MDRTLWLQSFTEHGMPRWPCPICKRGHTVLVEKSITFKENVNSAKLHDEEAWDPEWIDYVFTAWAACSDQRCKQQFAISGTGGVGPFFDDERGTEWYDVFNPAFCSPMPDIIDVPSKSPDEVTAPLRESFSLFMAHPEACAGRIRVALEHLMNHLGIPKRKKGKSGKFFDLTLHGRLDHYAEKDSQIGAQLMALKWLGNAGSHDGSVSKHDLLDAFEIFEHALSEIIGQRSARVATLAKKLTKRHGKTK